MSAPVPIPERPEIDRLQVLRAELQAERCKWASNGTVWRQLLAAEDCVRAALSWLYVTKEH